MCWGADFGECVECVAVNTFDAWGETPLIYGAEHRRTDLAELLISGGADAVSGTLPRLRRNSLHCYAPVRIRLTG